jgi:hypothetical protein
MCFDMPSPRHHHEGTSLSDKDTENRLDKMVKKVWMTKDIPSLGKRERMFARAVNIGNEYMKRFEPNLSKEKYEDMIIELMRGGR